MPPSDALSHIFVDVSSATGRSILHCQFATTRRLGDVYEAFESKAEPKSSTEVDDLKTSVDESNPREDPAGLRPGSTTTERLAQDGPRRLGSMPRFGTAH